MPRGTLKRRAPSREDGAAEPEPPTLRVFLPIGDFARPRRTSSGAAAKRVDGSIRVSCWRHISTRRIMQRGNVPTGNVRVILGMGKADCDFGGNLITTTSVAFALGWWLLK